MRRLPGATPRKQSNTPRAARYASEIAALGNIAASPADRVLALAALPLRGRLHGEPVPRTPRDVRVLARKLAERSDFFSAAHPAFAEDLAILVESLTLVAIAPVLPAAISRAGRVLGDGADGVCRDAEWAFAALNFFGLGALWPSPRAQPSLDNIPMLPGVQQALQAQIEQWYQDAHYSPTARARAVAAAKLQRLGRVLAGDRRGRRGRPHVPFHIHVNYVMALYRVARARVLLRQWPWVDQHADATDEVMEACGLVCAQSGDFDVRSALEGGIARAEEMARAVTSSICGVTDHQLKNILAKPILGESAK
jgi:hypothetical protein